MMSDLQTFANMLGGAKRLVVLTGAGMSQESGIPTFRDAMEGLWAQYDPMELATPEAFARNPKLVWDWYQFRRELVNKAAPNPGHHALVELEALLPQVIIITQNVDGFHQLVGSRDVICLHGNIQQDKCAGNCQGDPTIVDSSQLRGDDAPPLCPHCNRNYLRPNVVWFQEMLPTAELERAQQVSLQADVMLVIGTSGVVYPAAQLPFLAYRSGVKVLEINPSRSTISEIAEIRVAGGSGEVLPQVVKLIREKA